MFELSAPGKTFLLGEYYVMNRGEAYILNTAPRFRLRCEMSFPQTFLPSFPRMRREASPVGRESNTSESNLDSRFRGNDINLSPTSPAGKFIADNIAVFSSYSLSFNDPYHGLGGFGASTAEFLLAYQMKCILTGTELDRQELLKNYLIYAWDGKGAAPSGADLLAQMTGDLTYVNKDTLEINSQKWPFKSLAFHLIHTQQKLATHLHLANLENLHTESLKTIFNDCRQAIDAGDERRFCGAINAYHENLLQQKWVAEHSVMLLQAFKNAIPIHAAKGCGAMGSDTLLLITDLQQQDAIKKLCNDFNLVYIASNSSLSCGVSHDLVS